MKKTIFLFLLMIGFGNLNLKAQKSDSLGFVNNFWIAYFTQNGENIGIKKARQLMTEQGGEALSSFKKGRGFWWTGVASGLTGGFLVGWELAVMIEEKRITPRAYVGAGLIVLGSIIEQQGNKLFAKSALQYNRQRQNGSTSMSLKLGVTQSNGFGFQMNF